MVGRVGIGAAVGAGHSEPRREHPIQLVADEDAVAHQVPALRAHPLVVETDCRQAVFDGAVGGHVHHRRAVAHGAELVRGRERRAGVGRLVADRPVVFGGVPDGFVNRQPQVGRVDHQVGRARRRRWAPWPSRPAATAAPPAPPTSPTRHRRRRTSQPRAVGGASVRMVSNDAGGGIDGDRLQRRLHPHPLLGDRRAEGVGVERLLLDRVQPRRHVVDTVGRQQAVRVLVEHGDLVGRRAR